MGARLWVFGFLSVSAVAFGIAGGRSGALAPAILGGIVLWSVIEYLMHRFAFHGFAPHAEHHADPKDEKYILTPFPLSLGMSAAIWLALAAALRSAVLPGMVLAGVWCGYLAYEAVHLRIHSDAAGGTILRALRRYHYRHHFADDTVCYGVTSPVWDLVFRTR